jgi:hypothetical protein
MKNRSSKPSHTIFWAISSGNANDPGSWVKIGCAWEHEDGQGLSVKLDLLPISYQRLVVRHRKVGVMSPP